ncbi:MAG: hypothetical protein LQ341_003849 [Variospora aurantia]|nr:MAG: hypothetical protein LQ341_003849 [Variospora aurantia]
MRYLNWDVLLFPELSRVPLREFKTTCHVTFDTGELPDAVQIAGNPPPHLSANPVNQRQLPIVTCFVPSLPHGCPFRVSLHSWSEPEVSRATQALTSPEDCIFLEARVLLDGVYAGYSIPNTGSKFDKAGHQECLRFPPFPQEMLMDQWWSAGEDLGRVRVVITEGLARGQGQPGAFRRVKNVVSFSFQHAPLAVLEDAGVAWPNPEMWYQSVQQTYAPSSPCKLGATDLDAHAHSPRRQNTAREVDITAAIGVMPPRLLLQTIMPPPASRTASMIDSNWTTTLPQMQDNFGEEHKHQIPRRWGTTMNTSDISMPDYSYSITPRSSRDASLQDTHEVPEVPFSQHESQFEELMAVYSPVKASGTHAPPATRVSSAANSPPSTLSTSSGPDVRITSLHSQPRAVSMTRRDAPLPPTRGSSDVSRNSHLAEVQTGDKGEAQPRIKVTPAREVKGRKEGKSNELDLTPTGGQRKAGTESSGRRQKSTANTSEENDVSFVTEGKRKRASTACMAIVLSETSDGPESSPSRKVSRKGQRDGSRQWAESPDSPETVVRAPLGTLHNIR